MCREQARTILPQGQYTEAYVTANLGDWLLFLKARLNPHAQLEIRLFAEAIYSVLSDLFPITMEAFKDYQLDGVKFSAQEIAALQTLLSGFGPSEPPSGVGAQPTPLMPSDWTVEQRQDFLTEHIPTKRERQEFWKKIT
jgi:thymidylate synthase ThyX